MRSFFPFLILLFTAHCLLFSLVPPVQARQCNLDPEYEGPFYSLLFNDREKDCAEDPFNSVDTSLWKEFIDNAVVTCVDRPELIGQFMQDSDNKDLIKEVARTGKGQAELGLKDIANLAASSDALKANQTTLFPYLPATTYTNQADNTRFTKECTYYGYTDPEECAQYLSTCLPTADGSCHPNTLLNSTWYQRTTSLKQQLADRRDRAEQVIACSGTDTAPNDALCDNLYSAKASNPAYTSVDVARKILNVPDLESYFQQSPADRQEIMSLTDTKAVQPFYLVIRKSYNCPVGTPADLFCWLRYFFDFEDKEYIIRGTIPVANQLAASSKKKLQTYLPLETGQTAWSDIDNQTYRPLPRYLPTNEGQVLDKVVQSGLDCKSITIPPSSFQGGVAPSRSGTHTLSWFFHFDNPFDNPNNIDSMVVWTAFLVQPKELNLLDLVNTANPNATERKFYPADTSGISQAVSIPQPVEAQAANAETEHRVVGTGEYYAPHCDADGENCCNGSDKYVLVTDEETGETAWWCEKIDNIYIKYSAPKPLKANLKGGTKSFMNDLYNKHKRFTATNSPENSGSAVCYFQWVSQSLAAKGINIASLLNVPLGYMSDLNCPKPLGGSSLSCIDGLPSYPVKSECALCGDLVGQFNLPDNLTQVIGLAASAYDVPPSLILGTMYAEGGFEPRCAGDDRQYNEADVAQALSCDGTISAEAEGWCQSCNNGMGPFGLNPAYFNESVIEAKNRIGLPYDPSNPGNMCNFLDAALVVAYVLSLQNGYDAALMYQYALAQYQNPALADLTSGATEYESTCHGHTYNGSKVGSCGGWSDGQAATAIRMQQGFCGEGNGRMDAHFSQSFGTFQTCH